MTYKERMLGYWPEAVRRIYEMRAVIDAEVPEFEYDSLGYSLYVPSGSAGYVTSDSALYCVPASIPALRSALEYVLDDSRLRSMNKERIAEWEQLLGIVPAYGLNLDDRRDTIIARIRGSGKLNTEMINSIVNAFTGGTARSWVANSNLYVEILPPPDNKQFYFDNVEAELMLRKPAHLGLCVSRNYYTWQHIKDDFDDWQDVLTRQQTWNEVLLYQPFAQGE